MGKAEYLLESFWLEEGSTVLLNPRLPDVSHKLLVATTQEFHKPNTIWLQSSGTESQRKGELKVIALAKSGILKAAQSVNQTYGVTQQDRWLNCLPTFHVGGLSIYARAFLAGCKVIEYEGVERWCPSNYVTAVTDNDISLSSLVPTQVYDLVEEGLEAPSSLRCIFVGGGALSPSLYANARSLGWPLLPSYGMTETSAQIATAPLESLFDDKYPSLLLLPHVDARQLPSGKLEIFSQAVANGILHIGHQGFRWQPLYNEFISDDRVTLDGRRLQVHGRKNQLVKILGETVNLLDLQEKAESFFQQPGHIAIFVKENARRGFDIYGACEGSIDKDKLADFNRQIEPFRRIKGIIEVAHLPRNSMGKILSYKLPQLLDN